MKKHQFFYKQSRGDYIKKIKFNLELHNYCYSDSELNSYTISELKIIYHKFNRIPITKKSSNMYWCKY